MTADVTNPNSVVLGPEDITRLKELVREGIVVMQEVEDLQGGLRDTVKAIAEETGIKPAQLNKVIKIAHKNSMHEERSKFDEIEDILAAVGRG